MVIDMRASMCGCVSVSDKEIDRHAQTDRESDVLTIQY